jgi:hypothetical protein
MLRKLSLLVICAVFGLGLVAFAGCGGDDSSSSGSGSPATTDTTSTTSTTDTTDTTTTPDSTPTSTGNAQADAAIKQAVATCKTSVDAVPQISASTKKDLEGICDKAGSGDIKDIQAATKEVCTKIVQDTIPDGAPSSVKDQALSACDAAGGG